MKLPLLGLAAAMLILPPAVAQPSASGVPANDQCNSISPSVVRACVERRIQAKERRLAALYPRALAQVRRGFAKWGRNDNRLHPRIFEQAHRDWSRFVDSNCIATAAFGGGSNSSISDRETYCREQELDRRIELYRRMANGIYEQ